MCGRLLIERKGVYVAQEQMCSRLVRVVVVAATIGIKIGHRQITSITLPAVPGTGSRQEAQAQVHGSAGLIMSSGDGGPPGGLSLLCMVRATHG